MGNIPLWLCIPFAGLLLCIAIFPLVKGEWWDKNTADGHTVVAQREDLVFRADDAGPHLTAGVFGAHRREQGNAHEVFVPVDIIRAFHRAVLLRLRESWSRRPYYSVPQGLLQ